MYFQFLICFVIFIFSFIQEASCSIIKVLPSNRLSVNSIEQSDELWGDAFYNLQDALDAAQSGDEIWIAEGHYYPPINTPEGRSEGFLMIAKGVTIIGGFKGFENSADQRRGSAKKTILDGNINNRNEVTDNAYNLFRFGGANSQQTTIDSLSFANAYNNSNRYIGGAVRIGGGVVSFKNCIFENNYSYESGAAIRASFGGGMKVLNSTFEFNHADGYGGAIVGIGGVIFNSNFRNNSANYGGGALYFEPVGGGAAHLFFNNNFWRNKAKQGGAVFVIHPCIPFPPSPLTWEQQCTGRGVLFVNNTFAQNYAQEGGAFYHWTFIHGANLVNNLFWDNHSDLDWKGDYQAAGDIWNVSYNDFSGPYIGGDSDVGNRIITRDPFVDLEQGDLRLNHHAESIDAAWMDIYSRDVFSLTIWFSFILDYLDMDGDGILVERPPFDNDGDPRWVGAAIDRGAHEFSFVSSQ